MATFTITTNVNIDSLTSKAGGDIYNINGVSASLTVDQDSRYGLNNNTSATMATISPSGTLGGSFIVDGRLVRLIPYNSGTGNVPADGSAISQGGASGVLIGVYSALNVAPTAAGAAMPSSGYIKVKQWNSVAFTSGALTGISALATGADVAGWIEVVGQETGQLGLNRLNQTQFSGYFARGEWYYIGTTDGNRSTTYQIPSNGVNQYHAGVFVENPTTASITGIAWDEQTKRATVTATSHGFVTGDQVTISGVTPTGYNTTRQSITVLTANTFTYYIQNDPGTYTSGGTADGNWEFYPVNTGSALVAEVETDAIRGKTCWIDTAGVLRFGHDGTNSTGGYIVPAGRRIRIGNVFLTSATSAVKTQNALNSTVASRFRPIPTAAGIVKMDKVSCIWSLGTMQTGRTCEITDCAITEVLNVASFASTVTFTRCGWGQPTTNITQPITVGSSPEGAIFDTCTFGMGKISGSKVYFAPTSTTGLQIINCVWHAVGPKASSSHAFLNLSLTSNITITNPVVVIGNATISQCSNGTITNLTWVGASAGRTEITNASAIVAATNKSEYWVWDGLNFAGLNGQSPRSGIWSIGSNCTNWKVRNHGSFDSPMELGEAGGNKVPWTRVTTTATVTKNNHGYRVGEIIFVYNCDSVNAISLAAKTITAVTTNTFDFVATNSGNTSGVLSFYVAHTVGTVYSMAANTTDAVLQNIHFRKHSTNGLGGVVTAKNLKVQNFSADPLAFNTNIQKAVTNQRSNSLYECAYGLPPAVIAEYGTHSADSFIRDIGISKTGVSWTRSGSTMTITSTNHGLRSTDNIHIANSSNPASLPNGYLQPGSYVTVLDDDTFTLSVTGTGSTSGTLDYRVEDSRILFLMNEASPLTTSYVTLAGNAAFNGNGQAFLNSVNDSIEIEQADFMKGYDSFPQIQVSTPGVTNNWTKFDVFYKIDTGSGLSASYKNAHYNRAGGGGSSSSTNVTMTDTTGVNVGDYIYGVGIADGAKVQSITNSTTIVVTIANAATVSGTLFFSQLPNESTFPSTGIRLKVKIVAIAANTDTITSIRIPMTSTNTTRKRLYSQLDSYTLTLSGLQTGSDIVVRNHGAPGTHLANVDANAGSTYGFVYDYISGTYVDIEIYKAGYKVYEVNNYLLTAANASIPIAQLADVEYA